MTDAAEMMGGALAEAVRAAVAAERARQAAEEERDAVLDLVADDVVRAARERDDRDRRRRAALATLRVGLDDALAAHAALAALLENA